MRRLIRAVLKNGPFEFLECTAESAARFIEQCPVGLVVTNSPELFLPFADTLPVLYVAACPDWSMERRFRHCRILQKPFHPAELLEAVSSLTGGGEVWPD